jgi:peptidyl-tRNA hydrolase, PTH1 family
MRLVVGLGNPGAQYVRTRHNVGFRVVQTLAAAEKVETWRSKFNARVAQVPALDAVLAMPLTFMNDSGAAVQPLAAFYKMTPADLLIVCDDFNLPFARLRMRRGGSDGGNNGLKDVTNALGTKEYPRLRIGIGRNGLDAIGFVLGAFSGDEEKRLPEVIERAMAGIRVFCLEGTDAAIELVNSNGGDAVP